MKTMTLIAAAAIAAALGCNNQGNNAGGENNGNAPSPQANAAADQTKPNTNVQTTGGTVTNPGAADPLSAADNEPKIKRTGAEQKVVPTTERITADQVILRDAPRGASLGTAKAGESVTEIAREGKYLLVLLPDPDHSDKQMGAWIYEDAVRNPATIAARGARNAKGASDEKKPQCAKGEIGIRTDHDFCAKTCKGDGDCGTSANANVNAKDVCDGSGLQIVGNGHDVPVKYCVGPTEHPIGAATSTGNANQAPAKGTTTRPSQSNH